MGGNWERYIIELTVANCGFSMKIESYDFGRIVIDGTAYSSDVIIYPDRVDAGWWREEGHSLSLKDIQRVFEYEPRAIIIGTGFYGAMSVPQNVQDCIISKGIELVINNTKDACKSYILFAEEMVG